MFGCVTAGRGSPAAVRERLAPDRARLERILSTAAPGIDEILVLSTCHRVELYATGPEEGLLSRLASLLGADPAADETVGFTGTAALRHLFRVTAGLDSLVVGERQIQGQVRRALLEARAHHAARKVVSAIGDRALRAGRRARARTSLGRVGESIGTATARLLHDRLGGLQGRAGVIVGAGAAAEDAAIAVRARGAELTVLSRTASHAHALATSLDARVRSFAELDDAIADAAFAIVAVHGGEILTANPGGTLLVDLSMPHAIAPELGAITVDLLPAPEGALVERGVAEANVLLDLELAETARWIRTRREPRWQHVLEAASEVDA